MKINYFVEQLSEAEALVAEPYDTETGIPPEKCWRNVRNTMEELAFRTAITYTDDGKPSLYYSTSLRGITCYEVGSRDNKVEELPVSREESRLYG